jgi:tRNA modification GTPase
MTNSAGTAVAILTPAGRGAVAVLAVEGPQAVEWVERFFRPQGGPGLIDRPVGRIVYGRWGDEPAEDVVVCRRGPACVEVHCHGGRAAAKRIVDDFVSDGAEEQGCSDWIAAHESSPIRAAARMALAQAATMRTAEILLDQYRGALETVIGEILATVSKGAENSSAEAFSAAIVMIEKLLSRAPLGLHLTEPWRVVVAGPPNVGKSSLVNALVGYERAIVFDQPGTTRDVVTAVTALSGWPIKLCDTAGWRASDDPLEAAGVERARQQAVAADCLLLVFDVSQPWTGQQQQLIDAWPRSIVIHNKRDLLVSPSLSGAQSLEAGLDAAHHDSVCDRSSSVVTSAVTGQGIDVLTQRIVRHLTPVDPQPGDAVPFTLEQVERLQGAAAALRAGDDFAARAHLLALLAPVEESVGGTRSPGDW